MSYFDDASLVLIPSGIKNQKIYSVKPLDGSGDLTFSRASSATRVNSSGLIESSASGLPRLDYLNSTCPRLILEPQRSNLAQYSEQMDNAAWSKNGVTVTANAAVSPDGSTNADKIVETATTGPHGLAPTYSIANSTTYTFSVFAKKAENDYVIMNIYTGVASTFTSFNVANGTIGTTGVGATAKIENYGSGWYRCMLTVTTAATGSPNIFMWTARANDAIEYTGNGVNGTFMYGCVLEAGAYATSYIPTLGTSVTRVAESASSASIPSLFGATEGSFFIECTFDGRNANGAIPLFLRSSVSTSFNQATYLQFGTNNITLNVYSGGSIQVAISSGGIYTTGQTLKISFAYKANDFVMYVNGVQIGTDTSGAISTSLSFVDLGSYLLLQSTFQYDGKISQAILFPTRLSNSDLAALTA